MPGTAARRDAAFVEEVNRAFHEEEAGEYDVLYASMHEAEMARWRQVVALVADRKAATRGSLRLLDIGTGTGFVPTLFVDILDAADRVTLADISPGMLALARRGITGRGVKAALEEKAGPIDKADFPDASFDVITMNSVAHHLPEPERTFASVDRWLKPGGLLVIAHEPNLRHFRHPIVGTLDRMFRLVRDVRAWNAVSSGPDLMYDRVNRRLLEAGAISTPMTKEEIDQIVDIQSPTAGKALRTDLGFDPTALERGPFRGYRRELLLTFQHLGKVNLLKSRLTKPFQRAVERTWPHEGAVFTLALSKAES